MLMEVALRCVAYKSFTTLINTSYSMKNTAQALEVDSLDSGTLSAPLSFVRSGYFYGNNASPTNHGGYGFYWSLRSYGTNGSNDLYFSNAGLNAEYGDYRSYGLAVRCELRKPLQTA